MPAFFSSYGAPPRPTGPCQSASLTMGQKADCTRLMNKRRRTAAENMRLKQYRAQARKTPTSPLLSSSGSSPGGLPGLSAPSSSKGWNPLRTFSGLTPSKKNDATISAAFLFFRGKGLAFDAAVASALKATRVPAAFRSHYTRYLTEHYGSAAGAEVKKIRPSRFRASPISPLPAQQRPMPRPLPRQGQGIPAAPGTQQQQIQAAAPTPGAAFEPSSEDGADLTAYDDAEGVSPWLYLLGAAALVGGTYFFTSRANKKK